MIDARGQIVTPGLVDLHTHIYWGATYWGVEADLWGCPSFTELARDGTAVERWNMLHPADKPRVSHVAHCLAGTEGPVIAATDYMRAYAEQIRAYVPHRYVVLGTDGFGRSDTREKLRHFFEVDRHWVVLAALKALADEGTLPASKAAEAIKKQLNEWKALGVL